MSDVFSLIDGPTCRSQGLGKPCKNPAQYLVCGRNIVTHVTCHQCAIAWHKANRFSIVVRLGKNWDPTPRT